MPRSDLGLHCLSMSFYRALGINGFNIALNLSPYNRCENIVLLKALPGHLRDVPLFHYHS